MLCQVCRTLCKTARRKMMKETDIADVLTST
ncbi:CoA-binding protein, partial [Salmonella enterica subsp. enterica serovar Enteritidis]|nr:CoA-binding protein [Salmonella enterica subsp. enterica serovar Enteritidis]